MIKLFPIGLNFAAGSGMLQFDSGYRSSGVPKGFEENCLFLTK
jgi:hypothetical protein